MVPMRHVIAVLAAQCLFATPALAVLIGQVDTFQSGTTENWTAGGGPQGQVPPVPPQVVPDGGPGGSGDEFLEITASELSGAGSRVTAMNILQQWSGNYLAAGVGAIGVDLRNLGETDLTIRFLFEDPIPGPPANEAVTTLGVFLPAGGDWTHAVFPILPSDLTALQGSATTVLSHTTVLRIVNSPTPEEAVQALGVLGVDNIAALAVPEAPTLALLALACVALAAMRLARQRGASYTV